ncbi:MAG: hypothetical protein RBR78_10825 [Flavobacteriaceae bacterium]|jgi:hypothetical protein|nr:hypothetical protein [Flavobacteriaceae bacterium]
MKKLLCIATAVLLFGCGSDDNLGDLLSSRETFFEITIDGQNYRYDFSFGENLTGFYEQQCGGNNEVSGVSLNRSGLTIGNSVIQAILYHYETVEEFDNRTSDIAYIVPTMGCKRNFELSLEYDDYGIHKVVSGSNHEITSVSLFRDESDWKTYKIEGNIEGNLKSNYDDDLKPFVGSYRVFIDVLK